MADKLTEYYKIAFSDTSAPIHRLSTWCGYDSKQHAYIKSLCEAWRDINSCDSLLYSTSCPNPMGMTQLGGWKQDFGWLETTSGDSSGQSPETRETKIFFMNWRSTLTPPNP